MSHYPPPQHKRAPKTSDHSKVYSKYLNGNLHMKKSRCENQNYRPGVRSHRISSIIHTLLKHNNVINCLYNPLKTSRMLVLTCGVSNCTGSIEGLQSPNASMWTEARRARGPCAAAATSALWYGPPPIVFCSILEAVPCSAKAYWSKISRLVFIRHASLCNRIATLGSGDGLTGHQARPPEERGPPHCRSYVVSS